MQKRAYVKESSFDAQERADVKKPSCDVRGRPDVDEVLFGVRERVDARKASGEIQGRKSTLVRMSEEPVRRKATLAHLFCVYARPQISPYVFVFWSRTAWEASPRIRHSMEGHVGIPLGMCFVGLMFLLAVHDQLTQKLSHASLNKIRRLRKQEKSPMRRGRA